MKNLTNKLNKATYVALILIAGSSFANATHQEKPKWGVSAPKATPVARPAAVDPQLDAAEAELAGAHKKLTEIKDLCDAQKEEEEYVTIPSSNGGSIEEAMERTREETADRLDLAARLAHEAAPATHTGIGEAASYLIGNAGVQYLGETVFGYAYEGGKVSAAGPAQ